MSSFEIDTLEFAKSCQWDIALLDSAVDASLHATRVLASLGEIKDPIIDHGHEIIVRASRAYVFEYWDEAEERTVNVQFDTVIAHGESAGISYFQNLAKPVIRTLFLGIKNSQIFIPGDDAEKFQSPISSATLVVPVLEIQDVKLAA